MDDSALRALLAECEREPIHIPGSIQSHGVLLACDPASHIVNWISSNCTEYLGLTAEAALGGTIESAVGRRLADAIRAGAVRGRRRHNPIRVDDLPGRRDYAAEAVFHTYGGRLIVELEAFVAGGVQTDHMHDAIDPYLDILNQPIAASRSCESIEAYLDIVVEAFREFCGFDRVMAYRFHPDFSGEVIAEAVRSDLEPFHGLRYPASDIPQQARKLYLQNILRVIPEVSYTPVPLVGAPNADGSKLDLSMASLRGVSPIHVEYMKNMGVDATMVASLIVDQRLWGLIACHHYSRKYVDYSQRAASELFSRIVSAQVGVLERSFDERRVALSRARLHRAIEEMTVTPELEDSLNASIGTLLSIFEADGATVYFGEARTTKGRVPGIEYDKAVLGRLYGQPAEGILETSSLDEIVEDPSDDCGLAGVLAITLSPNIELMLWRSEEVEIVNWAGKPDKSISVDATGSARLRPRGSFALWAETRRARSRPWDAIEILILQEFRSAFTSLLYRQTEELDRVNRELSSKNEEMESFIYSVSHDLKSPVVTMQSFVSLLREDIRDGKDEDVQDSLSRIENATSRMGRIIEELLELSRVGHVVADLVPIDPKPLLEELADVLEPLLAEKGATLTIPAKIPQVMGDQIALSKLFDNLIVNALKYGCPKPGMQIRILTQVKRTTLHIGVADDGPGIAREHHDRIFALFQRVGSAAEGTGVGLALVSKIARGHRGRVWVESEPGRGATFWVSLTRSRKHRGV